MNIKIKGSIKVLLATIACFFGLLAFQSLDVSEKIEKAKEAAIADWVDQGPTNKEMASRYINICLNNNDQYGAAVARDNETQSRRKSECIRRHAPEALAKVIADAELTVKLPVPLRWF